ncbi:MAG: helix-turn-helix transcriptional regulator, partial [Bacteroidota bacterium]
MKEYVKNRIESLEEFIRKASNKTTTNAVSHTSFYSYRHANRLFTALKGESINSYSSKIRIQIAADYLKYSSKPIFDIALNAGYESTAAFSKAFKKLYGQAPSRFRQENNLGHILKQKNVKEPQYTVVQFNHDQLYTHKVNITSDITHEKLYQKTKSTIEELCINANEWILLWDEDPELTKTAESRYFIGFTMENVALELYNFNSLTLHGKYAIF